MAGEQQAGGVLSVSGDTQLQAVEILGAQEFWMSTPRGRGFILVQGTHDINVPNDEIEAVVVVGPGMYRNVGVHKDANGEYPGSFDVARRIASHSSRRTAAFGISLLTPHDDVRGRRLAERGAFLWNVDGVGGWKGGYDSIGPNKVGSYEVSGLLAGHFSTIYRNLRHLAEFGHSAWAQNLSRSPLQVAYQKIMGPDVSVSLVVSNASSWMYPGDWRGKTPEQVRAFVQEQGLITDVSDEAMAQFDRWPHGPNGDDAPEFVRALTPEEIVRSQLRAPITYVGGTSDSGLTVGVTVDAASLLKGFNPDDFDARGNRIEGRVNGGPEDFGRSSRLGGFSWMLDMASLQLDEPRRGSTIWVTTGHNASQVAEQPEVLKALLGAGHVRETPLPLEQFAPFGVESGGLARA